MIQKICKNEENQLIFDIIIIAEIILQRVSGKLHSRNSVMYGSKLFATILRRLSSLTDGATRGLRK